MVLAYSFTVTWLIAKAIQVTIGLRVRPEDEHEGLDVTEHGETAYVTETMAVTVTGSGPVDPVAVADAAEALATRVATTEQRT